MARSQTAQLNVRSRFARERAQELAHATGKSVTEIVEDALRAYVPPGGVKPVDRLIRKGPLLVLHREGGRTITLEETNEAIEAVRNRED